MSTRQRFTAEAKVQILREHLENNIKISELAEKYKVHPGVIQRWKKERDLKLERARLRRKQNAQAKRQAA